MSLRVDDARSRRLAEPADTVCGLAVAWRYCPCSCLCVEGGGRNPVLRRDIRSTGMQTPSRGVEGIVAPHCSKRLQKEAAGRLWCG